MTGIRCKLINPMLRGWVAYFAVGNSSECFGFVKDWRLTYALFIGWVLYGGYLFFNGDWWSIKLLMLFIAFSLSFIVYRTLEIITDTR